ncbi:MAG: hypothetical protein WCR97_02360 [Bacilli bacterium]
MGLKKYEEQKVETKEPTEVPEVVEEETPLELDENQQDIANDINKKRDEYLAFTKKQKRINYIITGVDALVLIGALIMVVLGSKDTSMANVYIGVGFGIMILVLVATYISSHYMKKNLMSKAQVYIDYMYNSINRYIYDDKRVIDLEIKPREQMDPSFFMKGHFYKDLVGAKSRNFNFFKFKQCGVSVADLAGNTKIKGKLSPKFLGRFYSINAPIKTDGKVTLFQLKGGKLSVPLDDVDELKLVEGTDKYCIYTNDPNYKNYLNSKVISEIAKFKITNTLIDVIISISDNLISLGIDYSDEFMNIPVDSNFSFKDTEVSKKDLNKVLNVLELLVK